MKEHLERARPGILLVLLLFTGDAGADGKPIRVRRGEIEVEARAGSAIDREQARRVLAECYDAYVAVAKRLALTKTSIFGDGRGPFWLPEAVRRSERITVLLSDQIEPTKMGAEPYLERLAGGSTRIHLPAPGEEIAAEDRFVMWREMALAVICQASWHGCPHWLRVGIAETMGEEGAGEPCPHITRQKEALAASPGDLPVDAVVGAVDRRDWARGDGRAVSWALVRMIDEADSRMIPSLVNQSRLLLGNLVVYKSAEQVRAEYTAIVRDQLVRSGLDGESLSLALRSFIEDGFPEGSAFRGSEAGKRLRRLKLPEVFGVALSGRFASRLHVEDDLAVLRHYQPFKGGQAAWRLPWPARLEAWIGVRGRTGTNYALRPSASREGCFLSSKEWSADAEGRTRLPAQTMELPVQTTKFGFIWLGVRSPGGLGYLFQQEYALK